MVGMQSLPLACENRREWRKVMLERFRSIRIRCLSVFCTSAVGVISFVGTTMGERS
jgi:hypothetical protein